MIRLISISCALDVLGKNEGMDGEVVQKNLIGWNFGSTMIGGIVLPFCKGGVRGAEETSKPNGHIS